MLQVQSIRANKAEIIERLAKRGKDFTTAIESVIAFDDERKELQVKRDQCLEEANIIAKEIGNMMKLGKKDEAEAMKSKSSELKAKAKGFEESFDAVDQSLHQLMLTIPNAPHHSVPKGHSAEDNETVYQVKEIPVLPAGSVPHWELTEKYDIIDFALGVKIAGAGFPVYKGKGARLQRALINYFLDKATAAGYIEIQPPHLVNEDSGYGTGQLPDKEGQMYHVGVDNLYLIPTAEVPVTNIYRDVILQEQDFPVKNTAYTPCFRREAGSYGKDVRGLNRLHQFDKVEIVQVQHPSKSYETLENMRNYVSSILEELGLPYRVLKLCGGDMGFASAMTYDMEVWSAAQMRWLEVSSVSNFEAFQSNRLKLRYKDSETGKNVLAHTLNGSALALPRIMAALLENNQTPEGVKIPKVLVPYCGFDLIG
jgi:seryl-tRNA synthetase